MLYPNRKLRSMTASYRVLNFPRQRAAAVAVNMPMKRTIQRKILNRIRSEWSHKPEGTVLENDISTESRLHLVRDFPSRRRKGKQICRRLCLINHLVFQACTICVILFLIEKGSYSRAMNPARLLHFFKIVIKLQYFQYFS